MNWSRIELENNIDAPLYLMEYQYAAVHGRYNHQTLVAPHSVMRNFTATLYLDRCRNSLRPAEIVIFVGTGEVEDSLTPETFVRFVKLIFELDEDDRNTLLVYGIPLRFTDFLGWRFLGKDYSRRRKILILKSRILQVV